MRNYRWTSSLKQNQQTQTERLARIQIAKNENLNIDGLESRLSGAAINQTPLRVGRGGFFPSVILGPVNCTRFHIPQI